MFCEVAATPTLVKRYVTTEVRPTKEKLSLIEGDRLLRGIGSTRYIDFLKQVSASKNNWATQIEPSTRVGDPEVKRSMMVLESRKQLAKKFPKLSNYFVYPVKSVDNDFHTKNTAAGFSRNFVGAQYSH